jgi:hypothetical protein
MRSWIPTGGGKGQQQFTGLDKYRPEVTSCFMIFRPGVMNILFIIQKVLKDKAMFVTGHGGP